MAKKVEYSSSGVMIGLVPTLYIPFSILLSTTVKMYTDVGVHAIKFSALSSADRSH
jgi:hypothetical protein